MPVYFAKALLPLLAASLLLGACGPISKAGREIKAMGQDVSEHSWRTLRILNGLETEQAVTDEQAYNGQRFCYKTMSDIVCYKERLPGQDHRLTGKQPGRYVPTTGFADSNYVEPVAVTPIIPAVTDDRAVEASPLPAAPTSNLSERQETSPLSLM